MRVIVTHEELKEGNQTNEAEHMRQGGNDGCELLPFHHRAKEQGDEEQSQEDGSVPHNRTGSDDRDTDEGAWVLLPRVRIWERLDKHVGDDEDDCLDDGHEYLREYDRTPRSTRNIARELLRGMTELLLLVTGDHGPGKTAIAIPATLV